jgi:DNA-binding NarL/FixJ family response regulator
MATASEGAGQDGSGAGSSTRIFLIEDDPSIVRFVREALLWRPQWRLVGHADSVSQAQLLAAKAAADVYLVDLALPDGRGEHLLQWLAQQCPAAELLVFTVFGEESRLLGALQAGATGYVLKGCSVDELLNAIEQIRNGGAPISPLLARMLLRQFRTGADLAQGEQPLGVEPVSLSERETEVLQLVARGYVNREIADRLCISTATVGTHIKNLYRKLSVHSRVQVVRVAQERGLL